MLTIGQIRDKASKLIATWEAITGATLSENQRALLVGYMSEMYVEGGAEYIDVSFNRIISNLGAA